MCDYICRYVLYLISISSQTLPSLLYCLNQTNVSTISIFNPQQAHLTEGQQSELQITVTDSTCVTTSIAVVMNYNTKTSKHLLLCGTANGNHYKVTGVSDNFIQANKHHIINGDVQLSFPEGAYLNAATATMEMPIQAMEQMQLFTKKRQDSGNSKKSLFDRTQLSLAVTGTRSVLVVRIVATDAAPMFSEAHLSNSVFGNGADGTVDAVTMKSHFNTCSYGQLNFVQADDRTGRNISIRNGALPQLFTAKFIFCREARSLTAILPDTPFFPKQIFNRCCNCYCALLH